MIPGTSYSPSKAFIEFAHYFFEALANEDYQSALGKLDSRDKKWSKKALQDALANVTGSKKVCSPNGIAKSASPEVEEISEGYILRHRIPIDGKWSKETVVFKFSKKPDTDYFYVYIEEIKP